MSPEEPCKRIKRKTRPVSEIEPPLLQEGPTSKRVKRVRKTSGKKLKKKDDGKHAKGKQRDDGEPAKDEEEAKYWEQTGTEDWDWDKLALHLP